MAHDHQRGDLRDHRQIAGDEDHRAVLADGAREGQGKASQQGGYQGWPDDADEGLQAVGAQAGRRLFELAFALLEDRLQGAHHKGQADEGEGDDDPCRVIGQLDAKRLQPLTNPAIPGKDGAQSNPRDRGWHGKGQIDEGVDEAASRKLIAHQDPGQDQAEQAVD